MIDLPIRYSVHSADWDPAIGSRLCIKVDGVEQHRVIAYDAEAGWVDRYETDLQGHIVVDRQGERASVERVSGRVTVALRPEGGGSKV